MVVASRVNKPDGIFVDVLVTVLPYVGDCCVATSSRSSSPHALPNPLCDPRAEIVSRQRPRLSGAAHDKIVEAAKQEGVAFIVMRTYGRGAVERFLLGSVADSVVRTAPCAVVTAR